MLFLNHCDMKGMWKKELLVPKWRMSELNVPVDPDDRLFKGTYAFFYFVFC